MPLPPIFGHEGVKSRLAGAHASGKLPQSLLLTGPRGVGKQRLALWLAQLIHCEAPGNRGTEPCGNCRACRLVLSLQHPDVHWFVPTELSKRGGGTDADKQVELVAEALAEEMAARREQPLYAPVAGLASHPVASVRLLLKRLVLTPAMGQRKVFIVGDAERLIPQLGTEVAANALLKALEEPPADSVLILTAADPGALLPTVLSRVVLVRVARIADSAVTAFAQQVLQLGAKPEAAQRVTAAEGCIGKLFATDAARTGQADQTQRFWEAPLLFALGQVPFQARGGFTAMLDSLAEQLRREAQRGGGTRKGVGGGGPRGEAGARSRAGHREPAAPRGRTGRGPASGAADMKLSHLDQAGRARMVDVGDKPLMDRSAVATGTIRMSREAFQQVADHAVAKGDVLAVSEVAGTLAAKKTAELIPLCHPLGLDHVEVEATLAESLPGVRVQARVRAVGRTGVEMEALTAVTVALLTVYDMVKAADAGMVIGDVQLIEKKKAPADA